MKRSLNTLRIPVALGLLGVASVALAATGWYQFDNAFKPLPCQDGWMACMDGDTYVTPGMVMDGSGRPHPAHMRFGFFEFEPMPSLSPTQGLSDYSDAADALADAGDDAPAPVVRKTKAKRKATPAPATRRDEAGAGKRSKTKRREAATPVPAGTGGGDSDRSRDRDRAGRAPVPVPVSRGDDYGVDPTERTAPDAAPAAARTDAPDDEVPAGREGPPPDATAATRRAEEPPPVEEPPPPPPPEDDGVADDPPPPPPPPPPPEPVVDESCDDLIALEAPAMMGELGTARRKCLERRLASAGSQTDKKKISLVLLADAEARQDQQDWSRLMKRHLEQIDRSDPNMCFKYAAYLSRRGAGSAYGVIRWSDYALENKQKWSGNTYKKYVYGLYRLRAQAANKLWQHNAEKYASDSSNDKAKGDAELYRGKAKDYSREWLDYARASGQSTKNPMALCVSAAGNKAFCEGG